MMQSRLEEVDFVKYVKIVVVLLCLALCGLLGYHFFFSAEAVKDKEMDIASKKFYLMIENYTTPVANMSVSSMKRSTSFFGKVLSTRCRIADFNDANGKQGYIQDTVRVDKLPFLFVVQKVPDGKLWTEYLKKLSGTNTEVIMHGLLISTEKKVYFVPQRIFSPDNKDVKTLLAELNASSEKNKAEGKK